MNRRPTSAATAMMLLNIAHLRNSSASNYVFGDDLEEPEKEPKKVVEKEQMPLSEEEKQKLQSLSGKAKRSYIKELKGKYL